MSRRRSWGMAAVLLATLAPAAAQNHPELTWQVLETEHFRVLYHESLEAVAQRAGGIAESAYGPVTELYGYEPDGPVRLILKDYDDYANGAAYFYHDAIEIWTSPLEHDFELRGTSDWLRNVITHEFVHIISLGASRKLSQRVPALFVEYFGYKGEKNRDDILTGAPDRLTLLPLANTVVPMWFAEGVSQHQTRQERHDRWDSHRDMILRTAVLDSTLMSLDDMSVFGHQGFGNEFVYDHGYGLVTYLATTYGDTALADMCRHMSRWSAYSFSQALEATTGRTAAQVWRDWRASMARRYADQVTALGPLREGQRLTEVGFSNTRPVFAPDGRRLAYLSTLSRQHGPHSLVVRDLDTDEDEVLATGVASVPSWDPDGQRLVYVAKKAADKYGSRRADLFEYDLGAATRGWPGRLLWTLPALTGAYVPSDPRSDRLSRGLRALYPAVSPDGEQIAFVRLTADGAALGLVDRSGERVRYLLAFEDGTQLYTPRWSPDGRWLALSYANGMHRDIGLVDVSRGRLLASLAPTPGGDGGAELQPLIVSPGTDRDPTWSANGALLFTSDVSGIYNVYAHTPGSGRVEQVTNVRGGAFFPTVNDSGQVVYAGYTRDGFHLHRIEAPMATAVPAADFLAAAGAIGVGASGPSEVTSTDPGTAPIRDVGRYPAQPYGTEVLRSTFMPRLSLDEGHLKLGTYFGTGEALDRQSIFGGVAVAPANGDRDLYAVYKFRGFRPTFRMSFIHMKRHSARGDSSEARDFFINGMNFSLNRLTVGASGRLNRASGIDISLAYDRYDAGLENDQLFPRSDGRPGFERIQGKPIGYTYLNGFDLSLVYRHDSVARRVDRDINPRGGRRLYVRYDRMFNWFIEGFDEGNTSFLQEEYLRLFYNQWTVDWREYIGLPHNITFGLRGYGGWLASDEVDDERVGDFFDYHLGGLPFMRGYTFYSLEGRKAGMANATLRFPLLPRLRRRVGPLLVERLYGAVYGDVGKAWDDDRSNPDPVFGRRGPLRDVGAQLRCDLISFYSLPTRIEIDAAYGIDEVANKGPWKLYLTVLFNYIDWVDPGE